MKTTLPQILEEALEIQEMKLGLERMRIFDTALGHPSRAFESVHIAGTNGKGSVAVKIASAFPGKKVGLFTSPHIETYRERIQINGKLIPEKIAERLLNQIVGLDEQRPTYFELLTLLAFTYFAQEQVELAVLEVGLGGRLDATNIVTPLLSVITSIDLEHTQYLGKTLEAIAYEKGGIIKPGIPVVVGPRARYYPDCIEVTGLFAHYEEENRAIARQALKVLARISRHLPGNSHVLSPTLIPQQGGDSVHATQLHPAVSQSDQKYELDVEKLDLSDVPPCRFEQVGNVLLDVAHNPSGLRCTFERIAQIYQKKKVRALIAFSKDKDIAACLEVIRQHTFAYHFIQIEHPRIYVSKDAISFAEAFKLAHNDELILICGTFFMMAEARAILGRGLGRD